MKQITVRRLDLLFDADQITNGTNDEQAEQAIELINLSLQREPYGLGAQLVLHPDEIEVESEDSETDVCDECEAPIPIVEGGGLANKHHLESCSLYDSEKE
jgi:hypothetical protein